MVETPTGLVDLATGGPGRLEGRVVAHEAVEAWRGPAIGPDVADPAWWCVDAWLTRDWLGRWVEQVLRVPRPSRCEVAGESPAVLPWLVAPRADAIGVTRTSGATAWCRLAARARAAGVVPIHLAALAALGCHVPAQWPPVLVGVPEPALDLAVCHELSAWTRGGGRIVMLARVQDVPDEWGGWRASSSGSATGPSWVSSGPGQSLHQRHVRRAWRALDRAPTWPTFTWIAAREGGGHRMTHLELLDVSAQLDEARRDEDALAVACRAVRHHTQADHAVIVSSRGADVRVLASDGPPGDSLLAWRQLCREDGPDALVASRGWHAVGRHVVAEQRACLHVGACWPTREGGQARLHLLPVFARLVATRTSIAPLLPTAAPGLEATLVGESTMMQDVRAQIALAARAPFPVLIRGESGCGKELAARAIHALGPRRLRRCAAINCAALPDELIESELFGHVRGAFTGAAVDRVGLFDEADGGTLFLDEVGELGARAQAKLLRVLQDGEVRRVGENQSRRVDVRVIAATNVSLEDAVRRGAFRADLFYRLDVVRVRMPALRERPEDIPVLARHFWHDCTARVASRARLDSRVLEVLSRCDWPGNVRQLQNTLAALAVRAPSRGRVTVDDLPPDIRAAGASSSYLARSGLDAARREFEATYVREALTRAGGRPSLAARDLGLTRQGLSKLVRRLGLEEDETGSRLP